MMGVINVSTESKNAFTVARSVDEALLMAERYRAWGATLIDVGGQSTHLDADTLDPVDEISRVVPAIEALTAEGHLVAIDTWKPEVAQAAVDAGAVIVNDTGGLADPEMREVVAGASVAAIAVYVEGANPHDVDEVEMGDGKARRTAQRLEARLLELADDGIDNVIVDPGIALMYRSDYASYSRLQLEVIRESEYLHSLGKPVLIPIPRKRDGHRTAVYIGMAIEHKADIIRVHDVAMATDLVRLFGRSP